MEQADIYSPPTSEAVVEPSGTMRDLVVSWEKKRIRYNFILLPFGLLTLLAWSYDDFWSLPYLILLSILFGIAANACYFLGPLAELYCRVIFSSLTSKLQLGTWFYWAGVAFSLLVILGFALLGLFFSQIFFPN